MCYTIYDVDEMALVDALLDTLARRVEAGRVLLSGSGFGFGERATSFECDDGDAASEFTAAVRRHIRHIKRVRREQIPTPI